MKDCPKKEMDKGKGVMEKERKEGYSGGREGNGEDGEKR